MTRGPDHPQMRAATVWPTAPLGLDGQTWPADGPPGSAVTAMAVSAEVAAYAIAVYSRTGDTVCDPDCRDGMVIVEAVRARRHAVGIAADLRAWRTARAALTVAKSGGAPGDGMILDRPPDAGSWTGLGPVDLLLTAIGPATDPPGADSAQADRLRTRLAGYRYLAGPACRLVVVAGHQVIGGLDLASRIATAGRQAGWRPVQRAVALTATTHTSPLAHGLAPDRASPAHHVIIFEYGDEPAPRPPARSPCRPTSVADPPAAPAERVIA